MLGEGEQREEDPGWRTAPSALPSSPGPLPAGVSVPTHPAGPASSSWGGQTLVGACFPAFRLLPALLEEEFCSVNQEAAVPPGASSTTPPLSPSQDPGGQSPRDWDPLLHEGGSFVEGKGNSIWNF